MKKRYIVVSALNLVCIILFLVMMIIINSLSSKLPSQTFYERWDPKNNAYTQISLFTSEANALTLNDVYMNRFNLEEEMANNSIAKEVITLPNGTVLDNGRLWADSFSGNGLTLSISYENKFAEADVIFTGGDFFLFHPLKLLSGSYYTDDEVMDDRIIIDENLAWQLFGSSNVNGMPVKISGQNFIIAGVIEADNDSASKLVKSEKPIMYISYEAAMKLYGDANITCYEACIPEPIKGLGLKLFNDALSPDEKNTIVLENKTRYSFKNLYTIIKDYNISRIHNNPIIYPYWENAAKITENKAATAFLFLLISLIIPIITIIVLICVIIKKRKQIFSQIYGKLKEVATNWFNRIKLRKQNKSTE